VWRILNFLWSGQWKIPEKCFHKWDMLKEVTIWNPGESEEKGNKPTGIRYILQCTKCGEITQRGD